MISAELRPELCRYLWGKSKCLHSGRAQKQINYIIKEVAELIEASEKLDAHDNGSIGTPCEDLLNEFDDAVGDVLVTVLNAAFARYRDPAECLRMAVETIEKRKGKTVDGVFHKEEFTGFIK